MQRLLLSLVFVALVSLAPARAAWAGPGDMSADEYRTYRAYQAALEDPRVVKMKPARRLGAIAKNFKISVKALKAIITKGEAHAEGLVAENQAALEAALKESKVSAQVSFVELVEQKGTVIAYLAWKNADSARLPQEAAYLAEAAAQAAPLVEVFAIWSCTGPLKVFSAKITGRSAGRIKATRVEDFAATRYMRLFEDVHNRHAGSAPPDSKGCE